MDKFVIKGGRRLVGEVTISGAKNAAVAILPAVILSDDVCVVENVPSSLGSAAYMSGLFFASFFTGMREILLLAAVSAVVAAIGATSHRVSLADLCGVT